MNNSLCLKAYGLGSMWKCFGASCFARISLYLTEQKFSEGEKHNVSASPPVCGSFAWPPPSQVPELQGGSCAPRQTLVHVHESCFEVVSRGTTQDLLLRLFLSVPRAYFASWTSLTSSPAFVGAIVSPNPLTEFHEGADSIATT